MSEYKFCRRCGTQLGPDDNFCTACGAPTDEDFLVAGDGLPVMPVGQVAPEAPLPEAAAPVPGALDVAAASGETVSSDNPTAIWGGADTAAIPEPMAPSVSPAMGWGPSPEQSGVAPDAGTVDTPSGPLPASDVLGPSDVSGGAEAFNTDGIASASAQPFAFVPPYGGGVTGASDAVAQAPVTATSPSDADISSVSADTDDRWFAKVLDVDDAPAAFASASGGDAPADVPVDAPAPPADAPVDATVPPAAFTSASGDDATVPPADAPAIPPAAFAAASGGDAPASPVDAPAPPAAFASASGGDAPASPVDAPVDAPAPPAAFASASGGEAPAVSGGAPIPYLGVSEPDTNAPASSANAPIMPVDLRPTGDSPMPGASTAATVDSAATRRSPKRKVAAGIGVVLLVVLAVLGFFVYKHSREEAARDAIVATTQSMVACDEGLQRLDSVAELNHSYLLPDKTDTAKADKTDTAKRGLDEASSSLTDARRSLESAKSDGWALDDDARHTLDVLQDGLDARRGMIDAGSQLVNSLADVQSAAEELAHLMADSSLFLDSSDNAVNTLNSSSRYIDQIDTTTMINDLESAKKYQASMSDDLRAAREKLPSANLSSYQTTVERASTMVTALQDILDAIQAQDAAKANDAATALNAAIDSFNDARRGLPSLAEGIESLVPDNAKGYAKDYRAQRERVVETLAELGGNPLTRDVVNGSKLLQGSHA
ncbi:zinc ribbon domain-containing protein [Olsenella sp. oral taxon 807]|uniref:zinc ribbon domain-containing protein n=1 Tax=Olsenella sp. oral taxon 807 TaxID=712411 RepID=UPI000A8B2C05|nr:zinc ribbon domain-containing protein [Olsenella sp. oral taxon 807]